MIDIKDRVCEAVAADRHSRLAARKGNQTHVYELIRPKSGITEQTNRL